MLKGYLKIAVLKELNDRSLSGYDLMIRLENILGKKPSSGSIYPLLGDLNDKGLISVKEEGRKKTYSLTAKGRKDVMKLFKEKENLIAKKIEVLDLFGSITGSKELESMKCLLQSCSHPAPENFKDMKLWAELMDVAHLLINSGNYNDIRDDMREVVSETITKLNEIKRKH